MVSDPIRLTDEELGLLMERDFFFARKAIRAKLRHLFSALREALLPHLTDSEGWHAPKGLDVLKGQIAGGEYYRDLPYVYLDLPKHFSKEATFTFRWMAWWGHYFFFAFISHGPAAALHIERLLGGWEGFCGHGLFLARSDDPWDWRIEPEVVMPVAPITREPAVELLARHPFLKLMRVVPFDDPVVVQGNLIHEAEAFFTFLKPLFTLQAP